MKSVKHRKIIAALRETRRLAAGIEGWLTDREVDFLFLLGAFRRTPGVTLELGSYQGKSTVVLAKGSLQLDATPLVSVDPKAGDVLRKNLRTAQVDQVVHVRRAFSTDVLSQWRLPIGLFWHDGANSQDVVTADLHGAWPHLQDGAVVAFHDVLNRTGSRIEVFVNEVLSSPHFGPVGVCGSIGWGQFRVDPMQAARYTTQRSQLAARLQRLIPFHATAFRKLGRAKRMHYKALRSLVPHGRVHPAHWLRQVA